MSEFKEFKEFKEFEGMTLQGSTIEQRHEIWKLLFDNKLLCDQDENFETELLCLNKLSFYMLPGNAGFIPDHFPDSTETINISFEEFKTRLSQL
jgi:hypothetical protein